MGITSAAVGKWPTARKILKETESKHRPEIPQDVFMNMINTLIERISIDLYTNIITYRNARSIMYIIVCVRSICLGSEIRRTNQVSYILIHKYIYIHQIYFVTFKKHCISIANAKNIFLANFI